MMKSTGNDTKRRARAGSVLLLALLAPSAVADDTGFRSAWAETVERTWIGPEYFANRLQDWRIDDGRLECVEAAGRFPLRTVHLLTRSLRRAGGDLAMTVQTGWVDADAAGSARHWAGFLIGAGGDHVDYRLTALVHHRPAVDGGLLAVVDGEGVVSFRDNTRGARAGSLWSIAGPLEPEDAPLLDGTSRRGATPDGDASRSLELRLEAAADGDGYTLTLSARDVATDALVSEATVTGVEPGLVDGALALVSHLGPEGGAHGAWFRDWTISGSKIATHDDRVFGPVLATQHTVSRDVLKLTAQMGPLGEQDAKTAELRIRRANGDWETVAVADLAEHSFTFTFRVEPWDASRATPYRVVYPLRGSPGVHAYEGTIPAEPRGKDPFVVAAFTGHKVYTGGLQWNHDGVWFPHRDIVEAVRVHAPDVLFFSGDQIYEGDLTPADRRSDDKAMLDYLYKWSRWCWAFGELTRDIPCVCIPDDHDVYHGNIWGAGGRAARAREGVSAQDSGGYRMPPFFVNAVHRTQTSHLPDAFDPEPVEQGISVYYTSVEYAGVSLAVIADRQFKSSPTVMVPEGDVVNGWFRNPDFDPRDADVPGAVLLGRRQLDFLRHWAADWSGGTWMKAVLSQTIFSNVATIPRDAPSGSVLPGLPALPPDVYPTGYKLAADADSNGWPQSGRNRALRLMRSAFALHIAGDQHLASTIRYGIDDWGDAGYALSTPSIANTWPRRWYPPEPGANRPPGAPPYARDFLDGFGNHMTVCAVANPVLSGREPSRLHDRAPGYVIVRFGRRSRDIAIECWPRWADPTDADAEQYPGWPVTFNQLDNGGAGGLFLPPLEITGMSDPVVQVVDERNGEVVSTLRIPGAQHQPRVFRPGSYAVTVGEPGTPRLRTLEGLDASPTAERAVVRITFETR